MNDVVTVPDKPVLIPPGMMELVKKQMAAGCDLTPLTSLQRGEYLIQFAQNQGLDPMTNPFSLMTTADNKLVIYATKTCTDQLRKRDNISIKILSRKPSDGKIFTVEAEAKTPDGRTDVAVGVVWLQKKLPNSDKIVDLTGNELANAYMKAETKAKRRVTLSICGLGIPDESEIETIPQVKVVQVDLGKQMGGDGSKQITSDQGKQLLVLWEKIGRSVEHALTFYGVKSVMDLNETQYNHAKSMAEKLQKFSPGPQSETKSNV